MNCKSIVCAVAAVATLLLAKNAEAATLLPYLDPVRDEVSNQLTLAGTPTPANRKLINSLNAALKQLNKPGLTSLANDTRLLSTLVPALLKTSVSNVFLPLLDTAKDNYSAYLRDAANTSSNRLSAALPSKTQTAADKALAGVFALLDQADANPDLKASTKTLAKVPAKLIAADKVITRALAVNTVSGGADLTAKVSGAVNLNFKSRNTVTKLNVINNYNSVSITGWTGTSQTAYALNLALFDVQPGDNTLDVGVGIEKGAWVVFAKGTAADTGIGFASTSGTVQVNYNTSTRTLKGTFSASCVNGDDATKQVDITGSFNLRLP